MTPTTIQGAASHARKQLEVIDAAYGRLAAVEYAAGMLGGIENFLTANCGPQLSYDVINGIADLVVENNAVI